MVKVRKHEIVPHVIPFPYSQNGMRESKRQKIRGPAEKGMNGGAAFPGDGVGAPFTVPVAVVADVGEGPGAGAAEGGRENPQEEKEGAESLHAAGRERALVTFKTMPN